MTESQIVRLRANRQVIIARWFYTTGFLVVGLLAALVLKLQPTVSLPLMFDLFAAALAGNVIILIWYLYLRGSASDEAIVWLSSIQIIFELALLTIALCAFDRPGSTVPSFFFIPIVESIVLFGPAGPLVVAILSGLLVNGVLLWPFITTTTWPPEMALSGLLIGVVYLIVGFFAAAISRLVAERSLLLAREATEREERVVELERFTKELQKGRDELTAKDFALTKANERLRQLEQAKSKFVTITTHQLRTPLAAIKWTFDLLLKGSMGAVSDEQKEFLAKGFQSTERMIAIVNDLLNIDLVETQQAVYEFKPVSITDLIDSIMFEFKSRAAGKRIGLAFDRPTATIPTIEVDNTKLRMVIENLLDNAIKYTPTGGTVTIRLNTERLNTSDSGLELLISDSGVGIPPDDQKKIFNKFFRASNAALVEPDGSGLGLFIAKDIVDKHHGALWFESALGKGTTFHLVLPRAHKGV